MATVLRNTDALPESFTVPVRHPTSQGGNAARGRGNDGPNHGGPNQGNDNHDHRGGDGNNDDSSGGGGSGKDWITIATFSVAIAAHLARLKLENEGIDCVIVDEHLISTNWLLAPAIGGIKLQVPAELVDSAREILTAGDIAPNGWELDALEQARCRTCGKGEYIAKAPPTWLVLVSVLTFGLPLFFTSRHPICDHCGARMPE